MIKYFFLLFSGLLFLKNDGLSQELLQTEGSLSAFSHAITLYRETIKEDSFLDEGREYVGINRRIEGHAFFESNYWQNGKIHYKGSLYLNVPLMYDLALEEIVTRHFRGFFKVKLFNKEIDHFTISGHHFVRAEGNDSKGSPMAGGFYDLLYDGNTQVLVKRTKFVKDVIEQAERKVFYDQENKFYIKKDGKYFPVKRKRSVLRVLKDKKKEIRRFLKANKTEFRKDPESAIVKMTEFYDQETNNQ